MRQHLLTLAACLATTSSIVLADVSTQRILFAGQIVRGTEVTFAPGDYTRLFVVEREGRIRIVNLKSNTLLEVPFLAIENQVTDVHPEMGLFGLAFHPEYRDNGFFYVSFLNNEGDTEIRRYTVSADPDRASTQSATWILSIEQAQLGHAAHWMEFGPQDGYLYISMGDGGPDCDTDGSAQDVEQLLGKMLRIDVDGSGAPGGNYGIPATNPFAAGPGADEIWALGLRNPWGCAFDRVTADLYIADVGDAQIEELNVQPGTSPGGENYGWNCREGTLCSSCAPCDCGGASLTEPVHEYAHESRCCIVGGIVYRGCRIPDEYGNYFFADLCSNEIWSLRWDGQGGVTQLASREGELASTGSFNRITNFGEDAWGAMYMIEDSGEIWRMFDPDNPIQWADVDVDGVVSLSDLLIVLQSWGPCVGCPADVNGDDVVDTSDLLSVLLNWGDDPGDPPRLCRDTTGESGSWCSASSRGNVRSQCTVPPMRRVIVAPRMPTTRWRRCAVRRSAKAFVECAAVVPGVMMGNPALAGQGFVTDDSPTIQATIDAASAEGTSNHLILPMIRTDDFPAGEFGLFEVTIEVWLPQIATPTEVTVTVDGGPVVPLMQEDGEPILWLIDLSFASVAEIRTVLDGLWMIEITGAESSASTFDLAAAVFVDADFFDTPGEIFPAHGAADVAPDVVLSWADPTGSATPDVLAVGIGSEMGDQEDDSVFGTMEATDTTWDPPLDIPPGQNSFNVLYADFDDLALASPLTVVEGSIVWGNSPYAPPEYPAMTPFLVLGSETEVQFSVSAGCTADLDGDGSVGIGDLLIVLGGWGSDAGDVTGDGTTDVADLLVLLAAWGPCE